MTRPSYKELFNKLRAARESVARRCVFIVNQMAIAADAIELDYDFATELLPVMEELLEVATPRHYAGARPPQKSYEKEIHGHEMVAFAVESRRFRCRVYFKFTFADGDLWLVSLHADRP